MLLLATGLAIVDSGNGFNNMYQNIVVDPFVTIILFHRTPPSKTVRQLPNLCKQVSDGVLRRI